MATPLTGKLQADFSSFYDAVQTADASLDTLEQGAAKAEIGLNKMVANFSGQKIIQQAQTAVEAVNRIGDVTDLTEKEQAKLNATLTDAIAKYAALGKEAPADMLALAEATKQADEKSENLFTRIATGVATGELLAQALQKIGEIGLEAFKQVAEALPAVIEHTAALGNSLYEMNLKTGASVESLSAFRYVASQTGIEFDTIGTSLFKMEKFLGSTGDAAVAAQKHLDGLGLSLNTLKNERSDQAFVDIIAALEKIPNRAEQAAAGAAIFGKGFKDMAGLAAEDIHKLIGEAEELGLVMSTKQAAAAHVAEIGYKAFELQLEAVGTRIGNAFMPAMIGLESVLQTGFKAAVDQANRSLEQMGGGGGFLSTVAKAMGTGNEATAAQIKLYEYLRDGLVAVVRYGIEPLVTAGAELGKFFGEVDIVVRGAVVGYNATKLAIAEVAEAMLGLQKITQPWNAERLNYETFAWHVMGIEAKQSMASQQTAIDGLIKSDKEWATTSANAHATIEAGLRGIETANVDIAKVIKDATDVAQHAYGGVGDAVDTTSTKLKGFAAELAKLTAEIDKAKAAGAPLAEQVAVFGQAAQAATDKAHALGIAVSADLQAVADAFTDNQIGTMWAKTFADMEKQAAHFVNEGTAKINAANEKTADSIAHSQTAQLAAMTEYHNKVADMNLSGADLAIAQIDRQHDAAVAKLDETVDHTTFAYQQARADIDRYYGHQVDMASGTANTIEARMRQQGVATKADLDAAAAAATRDYNQMKESGLYTAQEIQAAWKRMSDANTAADNQWMQQLKGSWSNLPGILDSAISGGGGFGAIAKKAATGFATDFAKGVVGAIPIIGSFAGPIVDGLTKVFSSMFGSAGRDAVTKFAEGMGGFDALHVKLDALGASGEQLWIKLTQGVGKNNPQEAQAAIDDVTKALNDQKSAQDDAAAATQVTTEVQAQATIETATAAAQALDVVSSKLGDNQSAWKDWSTVVTGVLQDVANAVMAIPIPSPLGPQLAGAGGPVLSAGASSSALQIAANKTANINLTSKVQIQNKDIATAVSSYVYDQGLNR
jgi:hypothetical protein